MKRKVVNTDGRTKYLLKCFAKNNARAIAFTKYRRANRHMYYVSDTKVIESVVVRYCGLKISNPTFVTNLLDILAVSNTLFTFDNLVNIVDVYCADTSLTAQEAYDKVTTIGCVPMVETSSNTSLLTVGDTYVVFLSSIPYIVIGSKKYELFLDAHLGLDLDRDTITILEKDGELIAVRLPAIGNFLYAKIQVGNELLPSGKVFDL